MKKEIVSAKSFLVSYLNLPKATLADEYIRMSEFIETLEKYFLFNIDDICDYKIRNMTLDELDAILKTKIAKYEKYIKADDGYFYSKNLIEEKFENS